MNNFQIINFYTDICKKIIIDTELEKQKSQITKYSSVLYCIFSKNLLFDLLQNKYILLENGLNYQHKLIRLFDTINVDDFIVTLNKNNIITNDNQIKIEYTFDYFKKFPDIGFGIIRNFLDKNIISKYDNLSILSSKYIDTKNLTIYDCYMYLLNSENLELLEMLKTTYNYDSLLLINKLFYTENLIEEIYVLSKENHKLLDAYLLHYLL